MPPIVLTTLIIVAVTVLSLIVSHWFTRRALGSERPASFEDVAIVKRAEAASQVKPAHGDSPRPPHA
ncbi:hypothetical protein JT358_00620 [Micrococcales bacterium 31B]|nr:hypothetical protein [Micrococcales bacterium 31B]